MEAIGEVIKGVVSIPGKVIEGIFGGKTDEEIEEVVITGSRIKTDANLTGSSPVTTLNASEISHRGITRVEDLINDLPSITPELTANESNGATGSATIDLRGLGSDRTLVLVNGHRMGFGDVTALAPDINQIPGALVERIEVLTGGASSTYGSDAMAGVVNFVMKSDFEGLEVDYQYSSFHHNQGNSTVQSALTAAGFDQAPGSTWDGGGHDINVTMGVNSSDGKGNITAYFGYRTIDPVTQSERDFSACALSGGGAFDCAGSSTLPSGRFTDFGANAAAMNGLAGYDWTVDGTAFVPRDGLLYNYAPPNHYQRPDERWTAGMFGHYEVNESFEGYAEFQFMDDRTNAQIAPSAAFFVNTSLNCSNAFLTAAQFGQIGCVLPTDIVYTYIGRRNVEGGSRNDDIGHTSYRILGGARGEINDDWSYDVFANFSRTILNELYNNDLSITNIRRALDAVVDPATGNIVCRTSISQGGLPPIDPACVPYNVFATGGSTAAARAYLDFTPVSHRPTRPGPVCGLRSR